jgi:SET domain-containing protein
MAALAARRSDAGRATDSLRPVPNGPVPKHQLEIRDDPLKGRGVFAGAPIAAGTLIEAAPVIIVPATQCKLLDRTILHDYYFRWEGDPEDDASGAVALGLVSLCNHSRRPRARVRRNLAQGTLDLVALVPIAAGDEVTIDYNCPLWFTAQD